MTDEYSDEVSEENLEKIDILYPQFLQSKYFLELPEEHKTELEFIIYSFVDYMDSYHYETINEWDVLEVNECCLDTLPREISAGIEYFGSLSPVLIAFLKFLDEKGEIENAKEIIDMLSTIHEEIISNSQNPQNWGSAKSFVMASESSGFDMRSKKGRNKFMTLYNNWLRHNLLDDYNPDDYIEKPIRAIETVGRNEPCPCGSGKKYKKCCLNKAKISNDSAAANHEY